MLPSSPGDGGSSYHSVKNTRGDLAFFGWGESKISVDTRNHATNEIPMNANKSDGYTAWRIKGEDEFRTKTLGTQNRGF